MPQKLDEAKADEKLLSMFLILIDSMKPNGEVSTSELKAKLNCSTQTVTRLLDKLSTVIGAYVEREKRGKEYVYRISRNLERVPLTADGLRQMELVRAIISQILPKNDQETIDKFLKDAKTNISKKQQSAYSKKGPLTAVGLAKGRIDYSKHQEVLTALETCIIQKHTCNITFQKYIFSEIKHFCFAPLALITFNESIYVQGWPVNEDGEPAPTKDHPLLMRVQRILEAVEQDRDAAKLHENYQAHSYSGKYGIMPVNKNDSFKVKLITSNEPVATYLIDRIFSDDQKITVDPVNKTLTLEFTASNIIELQSFIYSFGAKVKVIEPANIVDVVKEQVKKLVEMYEL